MSKRFIRGSVIHNRHDPLDKGLVGEWRFDKNTGLLLPDYGGRGSRGTLVNTPTWVTSEVGFALDFDSGSNEYVDLQSPSVLEDLFLSDLSLEVFVKFTGDTNYRAIFCSGDWNATGWGLFVQGGSNLGGYLKYDGGSAFSTFAAPLTEWMHVVFNVHSSTKSFQIFRNSQLLGTSGSGAGNAISDVGDDKYIGFGVGSSAYFDGPMAFLAIRNRALTANEVQARYQIVRKRMQTFGGERRITMITAVAAASAAAGFTERGILRGILRGIGRGL